jgi:hypothetical protein
MAMLVLVADGSYFLTMKRKHTLFYMTIGKYIIALMATVANIHYMNDEFSWSVTRDVLVFFYLWAILWYFMEILKLFEVLPSNLKKETLTKLQIIFTVLTGVLFMTGIIYRLTNGNARVRFYFYMAYAAITALSVVFSVFAIFRCAFLYLDQEMLLKKCNAQVRRSLLKLQFLVILIALFTILMLALYIVFSTFSVRGLRERLFYDGMILCAALLCALSHRCFSEFAEALKQGLLAARRYKSRAPISLFPKILKATVLKSNSAQQTELKTELMRT